MNGWADAKKFLFEDMLVYLSGILVALTWDFWINFAYSVHLYRNPNELTHPYAFGIGQWLLFAVCLVQFLRTIEKWRYWK